MSKSRNTIKLCNLHRISLCRSYSVILIAFYEVEEKLDEYLKEYDSLKMLNAKLRKALNIFESVENLYRQAESGEQYAGFLRYILRDSR
ncbi:MAG: hypothetical protein DRI57_24350 [Deltaproteobacteria bacterium]|nr:MAG: hypothetical protein DRI57_24350 [Deltaproteobacteria bacterium]